MSVWLRQKKFNKREDQVVGSIGTQTALNSAERMHEARRECGQIFQVTLFISLLFSKVLFVLGARSRLLYDLRLTRLIGGLDGFGKNQLGDSPRRQHS